MFITIITHATTFWRLAKTIRSYYFKFRPILVELVADTKATDIDDKAQYWIRFSFINLTLS